MLLPPAPNDDDALLHHLRSHPGARAVRIVVARTQGSVPRDAGTWMAVLPHGESAALAAPVASAASSSSTNPNALLGTIGGGRLEFDAMAHAQALLDGRSTALEQRYPLGPALGQCCGGVVHLRFELHDAAGVTALAHTLRQERVAQAMPVALFGGGHVGQAIARALQALPVRLHWIDSREEVFPAWAEALGAGLAEGLAEGLASRGDSARLVTDHSEPVEAAVRGLAAGSRVLIMSFSHAEDFDVLVACLLRARAQGDLPFIGLIGSGTKWATFRHRLEARGFGADDLARVTCPIGVPGVVGKEPGVIAAGVVAQLMTLR